MANKTHKSKVKQLSKGQRIHVRRLKQAARNPDTASQAPKLPEH